MISRLNDLVSYDSNLKVVLDLLEPAQIQLQEGVYELGRYQQRLDLDPQRLGEVEERLAAVHASARKHRVTPDELPHLLKAAAARLEELGHDGDGASLAKDEELARAQYCELAKR